MPKSVKQGALTVAAVAVVAACVTSAVATWNSRTDVTAAREDARLALSEAKALWEKHYDQAITIARIDGKLEALQTMLSRQHSDLRDIEAVVAGLGNRLDVLRRDVERKLDGG